MQGWLNLAQTLHSVSHCRIRLCAGLQGVQGFFYTCACACAREDGNTSMLHQAKNPAHPATLHKHKKDKDLDCAGFRFPASATLHTLHKAP